MAYADIQLEAPEAGLTAEADPDELFRIGLIYSNGTDVPVDYVAAHKWFNLASVRGHEDARVCREEMADLLDAREIKKALKAARQWLAKAN